MDVVYFMRVPKTGSIAMLMFIKSLSEINNFSNAQRKKIDGDKSEIISKEVVTSIVEDIKIMEKPGIFSGMHEPFFDFNNFESPRPIYISLIREPIQRIISWFYYIRSDMYTAYKHPFYSKQIELEGKLNWYRKTFDNCILNDDPECQYISLKRDIATDYRKCSRQFCGNERICM